MKPLPNIAARQLATAAVISFVFLAGAQARTWTSADGTKGNGQPVAGAWYAGCQYDGDVAAAKQVLENLDSYYPGAKEAKPWARRWWNY